MAKITADTVREVSERSDILALVGEYTRLEKKGSNAYWGCCPFHHEKTPSFKVDPDRNLYHCFGCGAGGDAITFYREMEKLGFTDAVETLARKYGVEVKYDGAEDVPRTELPDYSDLYTRVATSFHYLLRSDEEGRGALNYVRDRGITDVTIDAFNLGYAPADRRWLKKFLRTKNYSDDYLSVSGLFNKNYPDTAFFSNRLMFPITDRNGKVIAFGGRLLEGNGPKYLNTGDLPHFSKGANLYAFSVAKTEVRKQKEVIFCEGYMDVLAYHQSGVTIAVAPLGTALTEAQVHMVAGFVDTVYLSFDGDGPGRAATWKAIILCRKAGLSVRVIRMDGGKDPAEIMQKKGEKYLTNWKKDSILDCDFLLSGLTQDYPVDTPEGKTKAALAFFPYLDALKTDMQKQSSLDILCQAFDLRPDAVLRDFNNRDAARKRVDQKQLSRSQSELGPGGRSPIKLNAELRILLSVIANFHLFRELRSALSVDDFDDSLAKDLFIVLEDCFRKEDFSLSALMDHFADQGAVRQLLQNSVLSEEFTTMGPSTLTESIKRIRHNAMERKRVALLNEIRCLRVGNLEEQKRMDELLALKQNIDFELVK